MFKDRFWNKVSKSTKDKCWNWTASCDSNGYGKILKDRKLMKAHRASWIIHFGEIPEGMCILHKCDNPKCVNPHHLIIGTQLDNIKDMINKRRNRAPRGSDRINAKITEEDVLYIRKCLKDKTKTQKQLSIEFSIAQCTISSIYHRRIWVHI